MVRRGVEGADGRERLGTWNLDLGTGDSPMELETNKVPIGNCSRHICGTSHDNRRQTERNEACFYCRGAKEEKQSLKEPSVRKAVQPVVP